MRTRSAPTTIATRASIGPWWPPFRLDSISGAAAVLVDEPAAGVADASASERAARGRPLLDGHAAAPRHGVDELGGGFFERRFWSLNAWP
jgi:hypothetical protein